MDIAKELRRAMAEQGVTVQQLSEQMGMSYQRLWNKLNGRTALTQDDVFAIRNALGGKASDPGASASVSRAPLQEPRALMDGSGLRVAIVVARWNELVTKELVEGTRDELARHGAAVAGVVQVPGTWELPVAIKTLLDMRERPDALVALGCIMQGQTAHASLLGGDVGSALMALQVQYGVPIAWGVLTPDDQAQALERAGLKMGNKGREAALAAIEMANLVRGLAAAKTQAR